MINVRKRDGSIVSFELGKIKLAIEKAFKAVGVDYNQEILDTLALKVSADFNHKIKDDIISVEEIQDSVEVVLIQSGFVEAAKSYILYRKQREKVRNVDSTMIDYKNTVDSYLNVADWRVK